MWFLSPQPLPGRYCDFAALPLPPPPFAIPAAVVPPTSSAVTSSVTMRDCIAALALLGGFQATRSGPYSPFYERPERFVITWRVDARHVRRRPGPPRAPRRSARAASRRGRPV